jgi:hypothetical protein
MGLADKLKEKMVKRDWQVDPKILLCPNVPKPMHGLAPRVVLGADWWETTRRAAYASTNFHCQACGVSKYQAKYHKWLEGHELYRINYSKGKMTYVKTVPLCHFCHNYIHDGRLKALLEKRKINHLKYVAIIRHGDKVLREAGLEREPHDEREPKNIAAWEKWRLVLNGKEYPPKHKDFEAWEAFYSR